ncbi:MAG: hypothetical protein ACXWCS_09210 [Burkholderiales bacterium]
MLMIRKAQIDALGATRHSGFEDEMVVHFQELYPEWSKALGGEKLRAFVRHGLNRAKAYGFSVELDLARYLHAMHALGERFDESPDYPWAAHLLTGELTASEKMDRLRDAVDYQLEARRIRHVR